MAKLRHIAITVPDPWKAAEFYMKAFGLKKVGETDWANARGVYLSDGTINIALLHYKTEEAAGHRGRDFVGVHHIGFLVEDVRGFAPRDRGRRRHALVRRADRRQPASMKSNSTTPTAWSSTSPRTAGPGLEAMKNSSLSSCSAPPAIAAAQTDTEARLALRVVPGRRRLPLAGRRSRRAARLHEPAQRQARRRRVQRRLRPASATTSACCAGRASGPTTAGSSASFGSIDSLFNLDLPGDALVNTDYRLGVPLTWRRGAFSARARFYHQSSHLGDELILGGNAPRRIDLSFETVDFLAAWEYGGWRVYGGGAYVWRTSTTSLRQGRQRARSASTSSARAACIFGGRLTGGVDVKWLEQADWRSGVSAKLGLMVGRYSPDRRGLTLFLEAYDGYAPFGQFFVEDVRYSGVTLQFDF